MCMYVCICDIFPLVSLAPVITPQQQMRQALVFVKENIKAFGGDPNKITIYGQIAGCASVLSPKSIGQNY